MKVMVSLVVLLVAGAAYPFDDAVAAQPEQRSAWYVGNLAPPPSDALRTGCSVWNALLFPDCALPQPEPIVCDHDSWMDSAIVQGFGGALFCAVPRGQTVSVEIHDLVVERPRAVVSCPVQDGPGSWHVLAHADPQAEAALTQICQQHPDDPPGTTRVGVFFVGSFPDDAATVGKVTLEFEA